MESVGLSSLRGHRSDIQVLRGLAVLLVVLYHAKVVFRGGYIGVDVFFVISGYVIGRLIVDELLTTGRLSFRAFYARRFRRILPALALMLAVVVLVSPLLAPIGAEGRTNATAAASALFSANFYLFATEVDGYFATAATLNPLLHTWSLAVEEQFYLIIPAMLAVVWKLGSRRSAGRSTGSSLNFLRLLIAVIGIGSLAMCLLLSFGVVFPLRGLSFAYFSPFTRAWEFCAGLALVVLPARFAFTNRALRVAAAIIGYGGIIASALLLSDATLFPGYAAVLPVVATMIAIQASMHIPRVAAPMVWLGDNSYGWYLWHWPLIVFAGAYWTRSGDLPLVIAAFASLIPAVLSRQLLERRAVPRVSGHVVALTAACVILPFLAILASRPITHRIDSNPSVAAAIKAASTTPLFSDPCGRGAGLGDALPEQCLINPGGKATIVLVGDSNAAQINPAIAALAIELDARVELSTSSGCTFIIPDSATPSSELSKCERSVRGNLEELATNPRDVVLVAGATALRADKTRGDRSSAEVDAEYTRGLEATLTAIRATGARTILVAEPSKPFWSRPDWDAADCSPLAALASIERCGFVPYAPDEAVDFARSSQIEMTATEASGVERWTYIDTICPEDRCRQDLNGTAIWSDSKHISREAAARLIPGLRELLRSSVEANAG